jgi:hypothetical protein
LTIPGELLRGTLLERTVRQAKDCPKYDDELQAETVNDLSRCVDLLGMDATLIAEFEMSQSS